MGDIKGEMNMYADDISVSETEVKGKLKKIKNSEEYRKFEQNEQRQAEKNGTWMHLEIDSHSSNEEFARVTAAVFMSRMNPTMEELEKDDTHVQESKLKAKDIMVGGITFLACVGVLLLLCLHHFPTTVSATRTRHA